MLNKNLHLVLGLNLVSISTKDIFYASGKYESTKIYLQFKNKKGESTKLEVKGTPFFKDDTRKLIINKIEKELPKECIFYIGSFSIDEINFYSYLDEPYTIIDRIVFVDKKKNAMILVGLIQFDEENLVSFRIENKYIENMSGNRIETIKKEVIN